MAALEAQVVTLQSSLKSTSEEAQAERERLLAAQQATQQRVEEQVTSLQAQVAALQAQVGEVAQAERERLLAQEETQRRTEEQVTSLQAQIAALQAQETALQAQVVAMGKRDAVAPCADDEQPSVESDAASSSLTPSSDPAADSCSAVAPPASLPMTMSVLVVTIVFARLAERACAIASSYVSRASIEG